MKLLFLCSSLEPCRDGVGDYVRLLAEACTDAGHTCRLLAVNDSYLTTDREEIQCDREYELHCLRLAANLSWSDRAQTARAFVNEFAPDWLSWNIVPYGFHSKGVIPREAHALSELGSGRHVQVLLHELWIGLSAGEPLKNRVWGTLQRRALKSFLARLRPSVLHTTNSTYEIVLAREGWRAGVLPLFGNIPVTEIVPPLGESNRWLGGIFGTVHPQFDARRCFDVLASGANASRRTLRILGIGRLGQHGDEMFAELADHYAGRIEFSVIGERPPEEVSRLLQTLDFGIATHPWALAGKSGVVAAMLDHGLPVIVSRDDWALRSQPVVVPAIDPLMIRLSEMPPELMAGRLARKRVPAPRLPSIANMFLESLSPHVVNV